jgi:hypothetical protein
MILNITPRLSSAGLKVTISISANKSVKIIKKLNPKKALL